MSRCIRVMFALVLVLAANRCCLADDFKSDSIADEEILLDRDINVREKRGIADNVAEFCAWLKARTGWGCDDPASRALWRTIQGVSNCNDFCVKRRGARSGSCEPGNNDLSTWCPAGQSCRCVR